MSRDAAFRVEEFTPERITIRDVGPWSEHQSVTNDAEGVIKRLDPAPNQRVFYYDSEGQLDELVHKDGAFVRFAPGPRPTPYPWCRQPAVCAGRGSCPLDPNCGD